MIFSADVPAPLPGTSVGGAALVSAVPRCWSFAVRGPLGPLLAHVASMPIADLTVDEPLLEDVVIDYYREAGGS